ncbi:MAG: hypothetical protein ABJG75_08850 [Roseobacter sp.]
MTITTAAIARDTAADQIALIVPTDQTAQLNHPVAASTPGFRGHRQHICRRIDQAVVEDDAGKSFD